MTQRILGFLWRQETLAALVAALIAFLASSAKAEGQEIHEGGTETIDVELRTVPFYAVEASAEPIRLAADLPEPGQGSHVWGIVAVEPQSGELYVRRLKLTAQ